MVPIDGHSDQTHDWIGMDFDGSSPRFDRTRT